MLRMNSARFSSFPSSISPKDLRFFSLTWMYFLQTSCCRGDPASLNIRAYVESSHVYDITFRLEKMRVKFCRFILLLTSPFSASIHKQYNIIKKLFTLTSHPDSFKRREVISDSFPIIKDDFLKLVAKYVTDRRLRRFNFRRWARLHEQLKWLCKQSLWLSMSH